MPGKPFDGVIDLDVRDSVADWDAFTGGRIAKVVFDVADDAYIDVERHMAAAFARD